MNKNEGVIKYTLKIQLLLVIIVFLSYSWIYKEVSSTKTNYKRTDNLTLELKEDEEIIIAYQDMDTIIIIEDYDKALEIIKQFDTNIDKENQNEIAINKSINGKNTDQIPEQEINKTKYIQKN